MQVPVLFLAHLVNTMIKVDVNNALINSLDVLNVHLFHLVKNVKQVFFITKFHNKNIYLKFSLNNKD